MTMNKEFKPKTHITAREVEEARNRGLSKPDAGLPDIHEIERVLGISPDDLDPSYPRNLQGRKVKYPSQDMQEGNPGGYR